LLGGHTIKQSPRTSADICTPLAAAKADAKPFCQRFSIIDKLDLVASERENSNRPGKKQISGFGLPPIDVTKIKLKRSVDLQREHVMLQLW